MLNYQPTSRRPIAAMFRRTAHLAVQLCVKFGIHPDAVSYASIVYSAAAAICFWRSASWHWLLIIGPLFCYVRLWLNMLDGMVALAARKASPRGEILNDLPDRVSDVLIFAGVAHSGLCNPFAGYWVAIMALFTAYVGTLGQAVGARREYGGVMSKPWRMVALHLGAWATFASLHFRGEVRWGRLTILDWTCLIIIAGCVQTVAVRLRRIFAALNEKRGRETSSE
ncbi:MAG TPA: hypothetical protein VH370_26945 [Humisphaera sp.]|jgi:phosphatidylglycerophosphate synthase|nr:hypothetical protein [Humisphaera sp.]